MAASETVAHLPQAALSLRDHLPVLMIVVPMMAAPLALIFGKSRVAFAVAFYAALISLICATLLLWELRDGGVISYALGGWAPPIGIEYRLDAANALVLWLIAAMAVITLPYAFHSIAYELDEKQHGLFYTCFLLCLTGLLGVVITGDAFNVFVFLEISSLSTYALVAIGAKRDRRALTAAYDYLIMGTIGATFFVIGLGYLYMATGTLNMADLAERLPALMGSRTVDVALAFITVGLGLKVAIYPLHLWLPRAYTYAPSAVTVFLAAASTKVAVYLLLRFYFTVFGEEAGHVVELARWLLLPFGILAMFAASLIAIFQTDLKKMLAYSSIGQIGYMLLGIGLVSVTGASATLIHLVNHAFAKAALFMAVGIFVMRAGGSFYNQIAGLGRRMPWTSAAAVIAGLSLIGVPGTAGFISKWVLIRGVVESGLWPIAILILLSSLLAVIYVWRMVEVLYLAPAPEGEVKDVPLSMLLPLWALALGSIWLGLQSDWTLGAADAAARGLIFAPVDAAALLGR